MDTALSLVSLNIEGRKHFETVTPFLKHEQPDVFCVQELCKQDVPYFESILNARGHFTPMHYSTTWNDEIGVGMFTALEGSVEEVRYAGTVEIQDGDSSSRQRLYETSSYRMLVGHLKKDGKEYTIGTLHFPVTDDGETTDFQREALTGLFRALESYDEIVFCGDMNAPRGREIFSAISERYVDNIPPQCTTSLDKDLHRAGPLPWLVDGLFSTDGYLVTSAAYRCGVSDHCAIQAKIERK